MIKKWIIKIFKINTYEKEYEKYERLFQYAVTEIEAIKSVAESYKRELESLKATSGDDTVEEMDEEAFEAFCEENEIKIDDLIEERQVNDVRVYIYGGDLFCAFSRSKLLRVCRVLEYDRRYRARSIYYYENKK